MNSKKILVIDDETDIIRLLSFRLAKEGFNVMTAQDGKTGLTMARTERPHLIVLDLTLPELPGEEVCKAVREDDDEALATTPIIMVTAKMSDVDRIIGKSIGANHYITKPFDVEDLLKKINVLIRQV